MRAPFTACDRFPVGKIRHDALLKSACAPDVAGAAKNISGIKVAGTTGNKGIIVRAGSPLTVNADVTDNAGGNIVLAAEGSTAADDLTINPNFKLTASGGNGSEAFVISVVEARLRDRP